MNPRCIVSHRFGFICVLVAKSASSTLEAALLRPEYHAERLLADEIDEAVWREATVVTFLRDPVERLLSAYQEVSLRDEMKREGDVDSFFDMPDGSERFEAFVSAIERERFDAHLLAQSEFLAGRRIDRYGCVETLDEDLDAFLQGLGAPPAGPLPRRRSRDERRDRWGYGRFRVAEDDLSPSQLERIRRVYAADFAAYHEHVVLEKARNGVLLRAWQERNRALPRSESYRLGTRGFYAELTTVARAMIHAFAHDRGFALDSRQFSYRGARGFADWFEPFCDEIEDDAALSAEEGMSVVCDSEIRGAGTVFDEVRAHRAERLRLGPIPIDGFMNVLAAFFVMIHRMQPGVAQDVERRIALANPGLAERGSRHVAIHVRRGDKVGDEDIHYPAALYVQRLGESSAAGLPIFAMSDDHAAVEELRSELARAGLGDGVSSLTAPQHQGFDVFALRREDLHEKGSTDREGSAPDFRSFISEETRRLLTEVEIAIRSELFLGTFGSNVGKAIRFLHPHPDRCVLFSPHDLERFEAALSGDAVAVPETETVVDLDDEIAALRRQLAGLAEAIRELDS